MNFAKTKERIVTKTFDHKYNNAEGVEQSESVTFSYYEKCLTPAFFDAVARFEQTKNASEIGTHLSKNITSWNLDWNGKEFLPSYENLVNVCDFEFIMSLVTEMMNSIQGSEKKSAQSPTGLAGSASSETTKPAN